MSYEKKYIEMMEEKTELFRTLQAKRDQLKKLDQERAELRSQQSKAPKSLGRKSSQRQLIEVESEDADRPQPKRNTHKKNHSRDMECQQEPKKNIYENPPRVFEIEEIGVDQKELLPWPVILKASHGTGTLSSMTKPQKDRVDDAVFEFLSLHMHPNDVELCKVKSGKKQIAALPSSMIEPFECWLDEQIDSGMLDKQNLDDRKKRRGESPVAPIKVQVFSWIEIIQDEFPDFEVEDIQSFTPYIRQFLKENQTPVQFIRTSNGDWCPGIPERLIDDFIASFRSTFAGLIEKEAPRDVLDISNYIDSDHDASANENTPQVNFTTVNPARHKSMRLEEVYKDLDESEMVKFSV